MNQDSGEGNLLFILIKQELFDIFYNEATDHTHLLLLVKQVRV
jgi:hypothetical protein